MTPIDLMIIKLTKYTFYWHNFCLCFLKKGGGYEAIYFIPDDEFLL
jgi:hypothetical protein